LKAARIFAFWLAFRLAFWIANGVAAGAFLLAFCAAASPRALLAASSMLAGARFEGLAPAEGAPAATRGDELYVSNYENVLGTSLQLKILASSEAQSKQAGDLALAEIDREAKILSSWDPDSEFSRWFRTRNEPVRVSPELFEIFSLFDRWRDATQGALDASAETITRVWQAAAARGQVPSQAELDAAVASVRRVHWKLDAAKGTATHTSDAPLAMNSFVKSYIVGRSADAALGAEGVHGVVVNIGGDLVVRGQWSEPVDIADPRSDEENAAPMARLLVRDRAVATSGDYRRGVVIGGRHYSHIVDPRTGMPADHIISSTVVAPNPADAGALATAFSVLSPEESSRLADSVPNVQYLLVTEDGEQIASRDWSSLAAPSQARPAVADERAAARVVQVDAQANGGAPKTSQAQPAVPKSSTAPAAAALWNRQYELTVRIELAQIEGIRIMRPFIAVWIEDRQKIPVRTIALWYGSYRYVSTLNVWFGAEELGANEAGDLKYINSISSATRPPGAYTVKWDGRADNGKLVKAGTYTVLVEASRERGTHQLMRQQMDFNGKAAQVDLGGNIEIASASLDYHKIEAQQTRP